MEVVTHSLSLASLIVCHSFSPRSFTCSGSSTSFALSPDVDPAPFDVIASPLAVALVVVAAPVFCRLARGASTSTPCAANMVASRFDMAKMLARTGPGDVASCCSSTMAVTLEYCVRTTLRSRRERTRLVDTLPISVYSHVMRTIRQLITTGRDALTES